MKFLIAWLCILSQHSAPVDRIIRKHRNAFNILQNDSFYGNGRLNCIETVRKSSFTNEKYQIFNAIDWRERLSIRFNFVSFASVRSCHCFIGPCRALFALYHTLCVRVNVPVIENLNFTWYIKMNVCFERSKRVKFPGNTQVTIFQLLWHNHWRPKPEHVEFKG